MAKRRGAEPQFPPAADVGYRANNALIATDEPIVIPRDATELVQYEGELVAVIGKTARNISEERALACVKGYTLGNDISERTWQKTDRTLWRAKSADTFKPMGPAIVSGIDPQNQQIDVRINGKTVSSYNTKAMIFSVAQYLARMSRYVTLHPGDIVWFGCDAATLPPLHAGDLVEVANPAIGVLANRVVRAT
jgi:2-keto-4-pentenoate hydratase/2-oxohepta-3-ene-1,7-dioic acid hydratase in catechol pathway